MTNDLGPSLGLIGGSGFYDMEGLRDLRRLDVSTPYGPPSSSIVLGTLSGQPVAFLSRHGAGHTLLPSEVPYRANVWALASLGVRSLVSISAVGSLQQQIEPLHFVVPDQVIDRTVGARSSTFFGDGIVAHVSLDKPYCERLSQAVQDGAKESRAMVHGGGALLVIEGPAFSTKAESQLYQTWGASIIGMTAMPEARLAREAGMCYACLACVTDYDTWHADHGTVTVDMVMKNLKRNVHAAKQTISQLAATLPDPESCGCCASLETALVTDFAMIRDETKQKLAPLLARYGH